MSKSLFDHVSEPGEFEVILWIPSGMDMPNFGDPVDMGDVGVGQIVEIETRQRGPGIDCAVRFKCLPKIQPEAGQ